MEQNDKQAHSTAPPIQHEPESRAVGILLNAPKILTKLIDTAVLLSVFTGILYIWGTTYYSAFIKGLGLEPYTFAFNVPPHEVLLGGANTLTYLLTGVALAYWSVGFGLMAIIVLIVLVQLILVPLLSLFLVPRAAKLGRWIGRQFLKATPFHKLRGVGTRLAQKRPTLTEHERIVALLWSSVELYIVHAVVWSLLIVLMFWGVSKSRQLGFEVAKNQLSASSQVEVIYGENGKIASTLCGRIGSDFILRSPEEKGKYIIIKEPTIRQITVNTQAGEAKPQATANK